MRVGKTRVCLSGIIGRLWRFVSCFYVRFRDRFLVNICNFDGNTIYTNLTYITVSKIIIRNYQELAAFLGKEIGVSAYHTITQEQIDQFADATSDHQWIHIDPERAQKESPFKTTIAHGYLTLSMLTHLWLQIVDVQNVKLMVNYGIEKLKFNQSVPVNSRVRLRAKLESIVDLRGITRAHMNATLEIEGNPKPAYNAIIVFLYHFNS
jgi:acyl dehydratase